MTTQYSLIGAHHYVQSCLLGAYKIKIYGICEREERCTGNLDDQLPKDEEVLADTSHITSRSNTLDVSFTPQQKAYIMSLLGMDVPDSDVSEHFTLAPRVATVPSVIKSSVRIIMDNIRAPTSSWDNNLNYVMCSPLLERPISKLPSWISFISYDSIDMIEQQIPTSTYKTSSL